MTVLQESRLFSELVEILQQYPEGVNEHTLLKSLDERGAVNLDEDTFRDTVKLFRTHFLLYNALYQLRDQLWREARGHLEITAVRVQLMAYHPGQSGLEEHDPMRDYYLDIDMLEKTTEQDIESALNNFWKRLHEESIFSSGGLQAKALQTLGLKEGCQAPEIKRAYRRLCMRHHPDRGGDPARLQEINEAMEILRPMVRH